MGVKWGFRTQSVAPSRVVIGLGTKVDTVACRFHSGHSSCGFVLHSAVDSSTIALHSALETSMVALNSPLESSNVALQLRDG